jgi:hypothetical protein
MRKCRLFFPLVLLAVSLLAARGAHGSEAAAAAAANKSPGDVLIFTNGDQLTGELMHSTGKTVTFKSDMAGEINVSWSKVKELHSQREFVVLGKGAHRSWRSLQQSVPSGSIKVESNNIELTSKEETQVLPIRDTVDVLDRQTFEREAVEDMNFFHRWTGAATLGATLINATQNNYTYTASASAVRSMPTVSYLPPRNRTLANFSGSYSRITQRQAPGAPALPDLLSSIFHVDAERDQYRNSRIYLLAQTAFDHNFSQGLDLQQIYGAGVGWTVLQRPNQTLDLRMTLQYEKQVFLDTVTEQNTNLVGSTASVNYTAKLPFNATFQQQIQYLPAYNETAAYSLSENDTLSFPLYKRFRLQLGTLDSYLNNPPTTTYPDPPNRPNSFQFTTGVSYTFK